MAGHTCSGVALADAAKLAAKLPANEYGTAISVEVIRGQLRLSVDHRHLALSVPVTCEQLGDWPAAGVAVPRNALCSAAKRHTGPVDLAYDTLEKCLEIASNGTLLRIPAWSAPAMRDRPASLQHSIDSDDATGTVDSPTGATLARSAVAASKTPADVLAGVNVVWHADKMVLTSTDRYILHVIHIPCATPAGLVGQTCTVPVDTLKMLATLSAAQSDKPRRVDVRLHTPDSSRPEQQVVHFAVGGHRLSATTNAGTYPTVADVIERMRPTPETHWRLRCNRTELLDTLARVDPWSDNTYVTLRPDTDIDQLAVYSTTFVGSAAGNATGSTTFVPTAMRHPATGDSELAKHGIQLDTRRLATVIRAAADEQIAMSFSTPASAVMLTTKTDSGERTIGLVMPVVHRR